MVVFADGGRRHRMIECDTRLPASDDWRERESGRGTKIARVLSTMDR